MFPIDLDADKDAALQALQNYSITALQRCNECNECNECNDCNDCNGLLCVSLNTADEFSEKGRCVGGGLKNGDLLTLKSAYASILPTHARRPRKFITVQFWHHLLLAKGGKKNF